MQVLIKSLLWPFNLNFRLRLAISIVFLVDRIARFFCHQFISFRIRVAVVPYYLALLTHFDSFARLCNDRDGDSLPEWRRKRQWRWRWRRQHWCSCIQFLHSYNFCALSLSFLIVSFCSFLFIVQPCAALILFSLFLSHTHAPSPTPLCLSCCKCFTHSFCAEFWRQTNQNGWWWILYISLYFLRHILGTFQQPWRSHWKTFFQPLMATTSIVYIRTYVHQMNVVWCMKYIYAIDVCHKPNHSIRCAFRNCTLCTQSEK